MNTYLAIITTALVVSQIVRCVQNADHLLANGVTFATDNNVGHWITKNGITFCSECMTCGSPQWKVCPVCETRMEGADHG